MTNLAGYASDQSGEVLIYKSNLAVYASNQSGEVHVSEFVPRRFAYYHKRRGFMDSLIGRSAQKHAFTDMLDAEQSAFVAVYGRRRVGKTFLIREFFRDRGVYFETVGVRDGGLHEHLRVFSESFSKTFYPELKLSVPESWHDAFGQLTGEIVKVKGRKIVVFFDELPWLATPHSGFLGALDHFWNTQWYRLKNLILIVCGSAASWMLTNIVYAKGGLHNRLTHTIRLLPFTLNETRAYFHQRKVHLDDMHVLQIYMALGGVPYYLSHVSAGKSSAQIVNELLFTPDSPLAGEFKRLFASLFGESRIYARIVNEIASRANGIGREELIRHLDVPTGGRIYKRLDELEQAGFIGQFLPYGKKIDPSYRLIDEYVLFYQKWLKGRGILSHDNPRAWIKLIRTPEWHVWSGRAFEALCHKHVTQIAKSLGLADIAYETGSFSAHGKRLSRETKGLQIDLLFDRADQTISVCEIKFGTAPYVIDKNFVLTWERRRELLKNHMKTDKQIVPVLITPLGVKKTAWLDEIRPTIVTLKDLMGRAG